MTPGAKTVVFCGASGGAGTTTVAVNIAADLPQHVGGRVLLIDGHHPIPGNAAALVGAERPRAVGEFVPLLSKMTPDVFASYLTVGAGGLAVLPLLNDVHQARHVTPDIVRRI